MVKSVDLAESQLRELLGAREQLRGMVVGPVREVWPDVTWEELARYVEYSWADTYQDQSRFCYSPGYLAWLFGTDGLGWDLSIAAKGGDEVVGVLLTAPRRIVTPHGLLDTGIATQLSVHPHRKGAGIGKLLHLSNQREATRRLAGTFCWLDPAVATPASSYRILSRLEGEHLEHWGTYRLRLRVIDPARVAATVSLRFCERPVVSLVRARLGRAVPLELIGAGNVEEATEFLNSTGPDVRRVFSPEELMRYAATQDDQRGFHTGGVVVRQCGRIEGVAAAYPTELAGHEGNPLVFVDWVALTEDARPARLARALEAMAREQFDACALVTLDPRLGLGCGYLPTRRVIGCYCTPFREELVTPSQAAHPPPIDEK